MRRLLVVASVLALGSCIPVTVPICKTATDCNCIEQTGRVRICQPSPAPNVSPTPPSPTTIATPPPTPEPSATPTPAPSAPPPTPAPSATPTPEPTPQPPSNCVASPMPPDPASLAVRRPGFEAFGGPGGITLYAAKSSGEPSGCHSCASLYAHLTEETYDAKHGLQWDEKRGWFDAYCRRYCEDNGSGRCQAFRKNGEPNLLINSWDYSDACAPDFCKTPAPTPSPSPAPTPTPSDPGVHAVAKVLLLNYGKCVIGRPFYFPLNSDCKELLATATPKQCCDYDGDGKADDATEDVHGDNLTWTANGKVVPDDGAVDLGCAIITAGPTNMRFNRTIVGRSPCTFTLAVHLETPIGTKYDASVQVNIAAGSSTTFGLHPPKPEPTPQPRADGAWEPVQLAKPRR